MNPVAQRLLGSRWMSVVRASALSLFLPGVGACVLPLQFEEELDGGLDDDNPPAILLNTADPSMLQVATIEKNAPPFKLQVEDKDLDDTIYLRVFRDYHKLPVTPAVTDRFLSTPDASGSALRTFMIATNTWCQGATANTQFLFEVLVSDRPFLDLSEEPLFRAVPPGAKTARSYWVGECQ
jgi:hypothetical protein